MSVRTIYEGLKTAISYKDIPYHSFNDAEVTILFSSWEQYSAFDSLLGRLPTPDHVKLCIYAEKVGGHGDGVAVTVSDEVQHLGYMQSRLYMKERVDAFEQLISELHRIGIVMLDYDYESFEIALDQLNSTLFQIAEKTGHASLLPDYARYRFADGNDGLTYLSLYFPGFDR